MKQLVLEADECYPISYSFEILSDSLKDPAAFYEFVNETHNKKEFDKFKMIYDLFMKYLFEIIDQCDHFCLLTTEDEIRSVYYGHLPVEEYDEILPIMEKDMGYILPYFDISKKESKDYLKGHFKMNMPFDCGGPIELPGFVHPNCLNNCSDTNIINYFFTKDNKIKLIVYAYSGKVSDYRDPKEIERHLEKYHNIFDPILFDF